MAAVDAVVGAAEAIERHYMAFLAVCSPISMSASGPVAGLSGKTATDTERTVLTCLATSNRQ